MAGDCVKTFYPGKTIKFDPDTQKAVDTISAALADAQEALQTISHTLRLRHDQLFQTIFAAHPELVCWNCSYDFHRHELTLVHPLDDDQALAAMTKYGHVPSEQEESSST